ncbi:MAG: teichoic acid transporter [Bacteroidetes bacterium]|nr:teichoic acid transporter [Bacteroidota bacterium]
MNFLQQGITNTSIFRLLSTVSNFLIALLLSRFLGPKVKGEATIILTTITFLVFFCSFVGGQALVYLVPRFRVENLIIPAYIWTILVAGISYVLLRYFHVFTWKRTLNICVLSTLGSVVNIHSAVLLAKREFRRYNIVLLLPIVITLMGLAITIFLLEHKDIYAYLYPLYIGYFITAVLSLGYCFKFISLAPSVTVFDDLDSSLKYGLGYQMFELLQLLNFRLYFYLLYHIQGEADLGLYSIGVSVLEVAWILGRAVSVIHYSDFSNHENEQMAVQRTLRYLKIVFLAGAAMLFVIGIVPAEVYGFVFGKSFMYVKYQVKWLFPGVLMYNLMLVIQSIYLSKASYGRLIFVQLIALIFSVTLCYSLIPHFYYSGASAAASVSFCICGVLMLLIFMKDYRIAFSRLLISKDDVHFINNVLRTIVSGGKDTGSKS